MGTIIVRGPDYCRPFIRPHPNGMYGVYRLSYGTAGAPCLPYEGPQIEPLTVLQTIEALQDVLPLGILGDYEILCTGMQLLATDDPVNGTASGIRAPGWIALSGMPQQAIPELLGHELAHELERRMSAPEAAAFWALVGQEPGDRADLIWERRPQERLAEYLSAAIWGLSQDSRMEPLPPETLARIREWALPILGRFGRAKVVLEAAEPEAPEPTIILIPGYVTAYVRGAPVALDVAPVIINGRTMVPIRFVAENLGREVEWDGTRVLIY